MLAVAQGLLDPQKTARLLPRLRTLARWLRVRSQMRSNVRSHPRALRGSRYSTTLRARRGGLRCYTALFFVPLASLRGSHELNDCAHRIGNHARTADTRNVMRRLDNCAA